MEVQQLLERVQEIRTKGPDRIVKARLAEDAHALSRAGNMQMRVELANESLAALCTILYELDGDGRLANVDRVTWRILPPVPWGDAGWKRWGLRNWEAKALRMILRVRSEWRKHVSLFDYSEEGRTWHLNRRDYPTLDTALAYLKSHPITLAEWRPFADRLTEATRLRMQRRRASER